MEREESILRQSGDPMKTIMAVLALLALALTASAADVAGTWKASMETPNGSMENTFVFKVDGSKLTGTASNQFMGDLPIADGKVEGDDLTFSVNANFNGNETKLNYKGKVAGNEMKITVEVPGRDRTFEFCQKGFLAGRSGLGGFAPE
jgi:opacity protein-like surface antigen